MVTTHPQRDKKPHPFPLYSCSCTFQVYEGKPIDPATGKSTSEKGMVARVVKDLVGPLSGLNHVVYMDNYFTSGPLVEELA